MTELPFGDLPRGQFRCIIADPPWYFKNFSAKGERKNPVAHYACLDAAAIRGLPVADLAAPACALLMWATFPMLPAALETMGAWGFAYKSGGAWAKRSKTGAKWAFGTGYCFRSAAELFLLGTRGTLAYQARDVRNLIVSPVREHSRKPDELRQAAERLFPGPHLELFARESAPGWSSWGNETDKFAPGSDRLPGV